ncbi:MAG: hypothetical protein ACAI43_17720 [Phycisphaerae bacterium]|nr:hypothetical protein [Tepidisphaeraceae bacterium]
MWRNGRTDSNESGGGLGKMMAVVGGVGLGAGLLYLLDPDNGRRRRSSLLHGVQGLGSSLGGTVGGWLGSARDYASGAASNAYEGASSAIGSVGSSASSLVGRAGDYLSDKSYEARRYAVESLGGEMPGHKTAMTICALSSMAIGAALMYVFDPKSGSQRRRVAQDYARDHLGQYGQAVSGAVSTGYKAVADKVGTGYEKVSGAVTNLAAKAGIGGGEKAEDTEKTDTRAAGGNRRSNKGEDRVGGTSTM